MDYGDILKALRAERDRVLRTIAALEEILPATPPPKRGRKSMGPEERLKVAKRMKAYWSKKRELDSKH